MKFIKSIKIEELVLICVSLFFLILLFSFGLFANNLKDILKSGWVNIAQTVGWWSSGLILIFSFYIVFRLYAFLLNLRSGQKHFGGIKFKEIRGKARFILRPFIIISMAFVLAILTTGALQQQTENKLMNLRLLETNQSLTTLPFFWLHGHFRGLFDFLTPLIIEAFMFLGPLMVVLIFVFYLDKNKKLFKGYVMSMFIALALALPFWYFFPINSPNNAFLRSSSQTSYFNANLSLAIENYQPNATIKSFQEKTRREQKEAPPVSTLPSMHWVWSGIIVYYLFKKERKTIALSSIWLLFNLFGTIYLGNHYLLDGLAALPIIAISLFLAEFFIKIEQNYRRDDNKETELKEEIKKWLLAPFSEIKYRLSNKA